MERDKDAPNDASNWMFAPREPYIHYNTTPTLDQRHLPANYYAFNNRDDTSRDDPFLNASGQMSAPRKLSYDVAPAHQPPPSQFYSPISYQNFGSSPGSEDVRSRPHYPVTANGTRTSPRKHVDNWEAWVASQAAELKQSQASTGVNGDQEGSEETTMENVPAKNKRKRGGKKDGNGDAMKAAKKEDGTKAKKAQGKGSRSGKNARPPGASDSEIQEVKASEAVKADIKKPKEMWREEDREALVSYIVDSDRWTNFKVNQAKIFQYISDKLLTEKSAEQVRRQWYRLWDCYKACRRRAEHTGGGDGDAQDDETSDSEPDSDDVKDQGVKKKKRKKSKGGPRGQFSNNVMDMFEQSKCYRLIDEIAHNDSDVVRTIKFNSHREDSASDGDSDSKKRPLQDGGASLIQEALRGMDERHRASSQVKLRQLELAESRERREADAEARRVEAAEEDRKLRQWKQFEEWSTSPNPLLRKKAEILGNKLAAEEGIVLD